MLAVELALAFGSGVGFRFDCCGIRRLEARPIATLSIEAQERHERMERTHRDD